MTADRDDLAAILHKHPATLERNRADEHLWQCLCGQIMGLSDSPLEARHRAHVAQMVLESDWLRGVRAGTWDECWNGILTYLQSLNPVSNSLAHNIRLVSKLTNPYRADRADNTTDRT